MYIICNAMLSHTQRVGGHARGRRGEYTTIHPTVIVLSHYIPPLPSRPVISWHDAAMTPVAGPLPGLAGPADTLLPGACPCTQNTDGCIGKE